MRSYVLLLAAVAASSGCHWDLNEPGTDPLPAQFYFPTGITVDPSHRFAYVSNGNADLKYGGGTLQMIDLVRFECAMNTFRAQNGLPVGKAPDECALHGPGSAEDWSQDIYAANGYPWCQLDTLDPSIVDCDETPFIVENQTVKLGNFAGEIALLSDPSRVDSQECPTPNARPECDPKLAVNSNYRGRRLFTAVRGDPSITYARVNLPEHEEIGQWRGGEVLNCIKDASYDGRADYDATTRVLDKPIGCDSNYLVQKDRCDQYPFCQAGDDNKGVAQLPEEPFGLRIDVGNNAALEDGIYQRLLVAHLATGQVSMLDISGFPALTTSSTAFFPPSASGIHGAYNLAPRIAGDPSSTWYMTSDLYTQLATFHVAAADLVVPESTLSLQSSFIIGNDIREIEFEAGGNRAFLTENNPPSVIVYDTHLEPSPNGNAPANLVSSIIDVCQEPSHMKVRRSLVAGPPGTPTQVKTTLYVVCFLSSQVWLVDPDRPGVDAQIISGVAGPNQIALNFEDYDAAPPVASRWDVTLPQRGYVTNYLDQNISVIDFDPTSPTVNHVLGKIGFPTDGPQVVDGPTRPIVKYKK